MATDQAAGGSYRYAVAGFLALVYAFNFMDRQIMSILQEPVRQEFGLSDVQLGMLTGLSFALFYTSAGIPVAWLADRHRRVPIMAAACGIWSLFTAACGMAQSFAQLAVTRVLVGAGEAGGSPPAYSLLSDYFAPRERGTAMAIYSLGVPVGSALGAALGGWVAAHHGWRLAFVAVGAPGVLLALMMPIVVREPVRGAMDTAASPAVSPSIWSGLRGFFADRTLALTGLAGGLSAFVGYAMLAWTPSMLSRAKGMALADIASWYSLLLGMTGLVGTFGAGWLADRLGRRDARWYAWLPALAFALLVPGFIGALLAPNWRIALACLAAPMLLAGVYIAPVLAIVQNATPPRRRAVSSATLVLMTQLIGLGGGPLFVGKISDLAKPAWGEESLLAGFLALLPVIALTLVLYLRVARSIGSDDRARAAPPEGIRA